MSRANRRDYSAEKRQQPGAMVGQGYVPDAGVCGRCSKWRYFKRADAKRAARKFHPGTHQSVYPCPIAPDYWHFGELPQAVLKGEATRDEIRNRPRSEHSKNRHNKPGRAT